MESKPKVGDKSLRDIWTAADKDTLDVLKNKENSTQSIDSDNSESEDDCLEKKNPKNFPGLFQHNFRKFETDTVSLNSIWTPTNNDNLKKETKNFNETPLIDLETKENSNPKYQNLYAPPQVYPNRAFKSSLIDLEPEEILNSKHRNVYKSYQPCVTFEEPLIDLESTENSSETYRNLHTSSKSNLHGTFESSLIDLNVSENANPMKHLDTYKLSKDDSDSCNESSLNDLEISENLNPKNRKMHASAKDYTSQACQNPLKDVKELGYLNPRQRNDHILNKKYNSRYRSSRVSNNRLDDSDSEKSLDELNEETFGKFSHALDKQYLTLSDISEATAACNLNDDQYPRETLPSNKPRVFEYSETLKDVREISTGGAKPKTPLRKVHMKNTLRQNHASNSKGIKRRNPKVLKETRKDSFLNPSLNKTSNSEEILSVSRENLTIQKKSRPSQNKLRSSSSNARYGTLTRETFHSQFSSHQAGKMATSIHEVFHSKGNMNYYTAEKIAYIRGEKLQKTDKKADNDHNKNKIVWKNNICDFNVLTKETINVGPKTGRYFQTNPIPNDYDKSSYNFDKETNYEKCTDDANNNLRFRNQNKSRKHYMQQSRCENQIKSSRNEDAPFTSQEFKFPCKNKVENYTRQANNLKQFNFDEPKHDSKTTSAYKNNHNQKTTNIEHNIQKHVTHFKVYDPKLHSTSNKKIAINQYSEHMKFKNSLQNRPYRKTKEVSNAPASNLPNGDIPQHIENLNLEKENKESKTFVKEVLMDAQLKNFKDTSKVCESNARLKTALIRDAKEIAELIAGSERALDLFKSFYFEWLELRKQSISLLEQIVSIINQSSRKSDTMKHVITAINIAAGAANLIPHPGVAVGAKVVGAVGGFFATFFNRTDANCKKDVEAKKFDIREMFQQDIDSSSYVYIYGVQCGLQFQETCNAIGKFHNQLLEENYQSVTKDDAVIEFTNELSEYNNSNTVAFYKRLQMCYGRLIKRSCSEDSRAFVRIFEDMPEAVSVIELLPWKFDSDGFDNSIVQEAWDELFPLFQDGNSATVDVIKEKVQNILLFLKKEHRILSRNVVNLFKEKF